MPEITLEREAIVRHSPGGAAAQDAKLKTGSFSCLTPAEANRILREFYGLLSSDLESEPYKPSCKRIELADYLA